MITMQNSRPRALKFNRPYKKAVVRRKGCRQVNANPSAARWRAVPGSRSRSSWNRVRTSSSEMVEQA